MFIFNKKNQILSFLDTIAEENSNIASVYSAGKTFQNRDLKVIVIKSPTSSRSIWLDCGIHAV